MPNPDLKLITTRDGTHSILDKTLDETYHSRHGAVQESAHVFINAGLLHLCRLKRDLHIIELGLGTGLNVALTWKEIDDLKDHRVHYVALEAHPLPMEMIEQLNYAQQLTMPSFSQIHTAPWEQAQQLSNRCTLIKVKTDFADYNFAGPYDLVYFDVFAPRHHPEWWKAPFLQKVVHGLRRGGILVTYGAQGSFRRALGELGMEVEKLPGPPGKREMTRATKMA